MIYSTIALAISVGVRLCINLVLIRILSHQLGPDNFAITGQISNTLSVITIVAGAGTQIGLARILARKDRKTYIRTNWYSCSFFLVLLFSAVIMAVLVLFKEPISDAVFLGNEHAYVIFLAILVAVMPIGMGAIGTGYLNGNHIHISYAMASILGNVISLLVFLALYFVFDEVGLFVGLVLVPAINALTYLAYAAREGFPMRSLLPIKVNPRSIKVLLSYSALTVVGGVLLPITYIAVRTIFVDWHDNVTVGIWQSNLRLSDAYLQFPLTLIVVILFPFFSKHRDINGRAKEFLCAFGLFLSFMALTGGVVVFTQEIWFPLLFSEDFSEMKKYLVPQLIGDTLKICSYVITTYLTARGFLKYGIFSEITQSLFLFTVCTGFLTLPSEGAIYDGYIMSYGLYLLMNILVVTYVLKKGIK